STGRTEGLIHWLGQVPRDEKVIVFTQFRRVQCLLARRLSSEGWRCHLVHGGQTAADRDQQLAEFMNDGQVLIASDAGNQGHSWQWARIVINFDLPWNPMRIEQRIGRVYRLGQERDVQVVNVVTPGTVEEYVVYLLHRKLGMFEQVIGDLDDVLGMDGQRFQ